MVVPLDTVRLQLVRQFCKSQHSLGRQDALGQYSILVTFSLVKSWSEIKRRPLTTNLDYLSSTRAGLSAKELSMTQAWSEAKGK
jgi:hypothetical protein